MNADPSLLRVIHRSVREARDSGLDDISQTQRAVLCVLSVRPDLSPAEALTLVQRVHDGAFRGG